MIILKIDIIKENFISVLENLENNKTSVADGKKDLNVITSWIDVMIKEDFSRFKERLTKINQEQVCFYLKCALDEIDELITKINIISSDFLFTLSDQKANVLKEKVNDGLFGNLLEIKSNLLMLKEQYHKKTEVVSPTKIKEKYSLSCD